MTTQIGIEVFSRRKRRRRRQRVFPAVGGVLPLPIAKSDLGLDEKRRDDVGAAAAVIGGSAAGEGAENFPAGLGRVPVRAAAAVLKQRSAQPLLQLPGRLFNARVTSVR